MLFLKTVTAFTYVAVYLDRLCLSFTETCSLRCQTVLILSLSLTVLAVKRHLPLNRDDIDLLSYRSIKPPGVHVLFSAQGVRAIIWRDGENVAAPPRDRSHMQLLWRRTQGHHRALWRTGDPGATAQLEGGSRGCQRGWCYSLLGLKSKGWLQRH